MTFDKLYISLLESYDFFNAIPASELGLKTKIVYIPIDTPYGFWVDKNGNFIPVGKLGDHEKIANTIIDKASKYVHIDKSNIKSPYEYLFQQGWLRLVCDKIKNKVFWEKTHGIKPNPYQERFMNFVGIEEG